MNNEIKYYMAKFLIDIDGKKISQNSLVPAQTDVKIIRNRIDDSEINT